MQKTMSKAVPNKKSSKAKISTAAAKALVEKKKAELLSKTAKKTVTKKADADAAAHVTIDAPSSLVRVPPEKDKVTLQLKSSALSVVTQASALAVYNDRSQLQANTLLVNISAAKKELEARRKFFVQPLKDHVRNIEMLFKEPIEQLESADRQLRSKVLDYRAELARKQEEERQRLAEEAAKKEAEALAAAKQGDEQGVEEALSESAELSVQAAQTTGPGRVMAAEGGGQVATRKVWTFEVVDHAAVPREYLAVNESAIRAAVRSGIRSIGGVRIFEEEQLAVGGR